MTDMRQKAFCKYHGQYQGDSCPECQVMRQKAFYLSIALAITDKLLIGVKPYTLESDRLLSLNHKILKVTDMYRPESWGEAEMKIAGEVFDKLNENIAEAFK